MSSASALRVAPTISTRSPLAPATISLSRSPAVIGRDLKATVSLQHPLVLPQHAVLVERSDGWWISSKDAALRVNGAPLGGKDWRLTSGDVVELAAGAVVIFTDPSAPVPATKATAAAPLVEPRARRRQRQWRAEDLLPSARVWIILGVLAVLGGGGWFGWRSIGPKPALQPAALLPEQAAILDSLLSVASDRIERGNVLLEAGAPEAALNEFAAGIATLSTHPLRDYAYVKRRIDQLRNSVGDVYRARKLAVPTSFVADRRVGTLGGEGLKAALSVPQFGGALEAIRAEFLTRFRVPLEVTGRDHPEHLSLYGPGGAVDLRSKTLTAAQLDFVIANARRAGIRVKDFSRDSVMRLQVQAARAAGLADRASTGLHLHLDRFANRRDRWTVQ